MGARTLSDSHSGDPAARLGQVVAERYELEAVLGSGGAGVLYRGRHVRTGRAVAVKMLHAAGPDATIAHRRLEREAMAAVDLEHPHVVDVLDFGEDASGAPYLVMELLQGHSLQDELDGDAVMSPQRVIDLMVPIFGALAVAHDRGMLHRDLKPANLFVVEHTGGTVIAKLLDFGIALVRGGAALTQPGRVVGTVGYMSPEQVHGEPLTAASDLWSLAAMMFRCLTGRLPRNGNALGTFSGGDDNLRSLRLVIARALEEDPVARFPDARSFARALAAAAHYAGLQLPSAPDPIGLPDWPRWCAEVTQESGTLVGTEPGAREQRERAALADASNNRPRAGSVLAERFLLKRPLGTGAMGVVYEAEHLVIHRPCAVKLLHPTLAADPALRERFRKEAQRAGRILHEHVVAVTDYGVDGETPFLVMELLRGESLRELLDRTGALPAERAAQISVQIARGLAAAHELGIVHRDLKPQNVFVSRRADGSDMVKILDFGVAKALRSDESGVDTQAGTLLGTVRYMAPEQLKSPKDVDARADVYAAGLILYEMLAGRPAFDANDMHATIHQLLYERPPALESLRPGLPAQLVAQVERAIEHAADARFASANDFAEALLGRAPTENAAHSRPPAATAGAVRRDRRQSDSHVAPQRRRGDSRAPWIAATVVLVLAAAAAWLLATRAPATPAREAAAPHAAATSGNESKTGLTSTTTTPAIPAPAVTGTGGAAPGNAARGAAPATTPTAAPVRRTQGTASTRKPTAAPAFDHKNPYE